MFSSDYGERMADEWKARLCWGGAFEHGFFLVDAEYGHPVVVGIVGDSHVDRTPRSGSATNAPARILTPSANEHQNGAKAAKPPPPHSAPTESLTAVWIALGSVAAVGAGLLAWKALVHRV